jgi:hypothetical protein
MPTPTCLVTCIQASRAHLRGGEGKFRESKVEDGRLASVGCSDMDGVKKAYEREARMDRSGATGNGEGGKGMVP